MVRLQFKLKHYLVALVWFVFALPRWSDWSYQRYCKSIGLAPYWEPMVPSFTFIPFLVASVLMMVGFPRTGFVVGLVTTIYVVCMFCVRWNAISSMGIDPMLYWFPEKENGN